MKWFSLLTAGIFLGILSYFIFIICYQNYPGGLLKNTCKKMQHCSFIRNKLNLSHNPITPSEITTDPCKEESKIMYFLHLLHLAFIIFLCIFLSFLNTKHRCLRVSKDHLGGVFRLFCWLAEVDIQPAPHTHSFSLSLLVWCCSKETPH